MIKEKNPYGVTHLLCNHSTNLVAWVSTELAMPTERVFQLLELGSIYLNQKRILEDIQINSTDYIRVHTTPRRFPTKFDQTKHGVVHEDKDFLICNKPHGLPSIPTVDNIKENLISIISKQTKLNLLVTSRLDIATSGLIVLAKNKDFQKMFNNLLTTGQVKKVYSATVEGNYQASDDLVHYMLDSIRAPKQVVDQPCEQSRRCQLKILSKHFDLTTNSTNLKIDLITGRTHQIRSQLSYVGFPILGDKMYGSTCQLNNDYEEIKLTCQKISFLNTKSENLIFQLENT